MLRSGAAGPAREGRRPRSDDDARVRRSTPDPEIAEDVTGAELSREARAELRTASKGAAELVSRHLVMAGRLLDDDPELAYSHAQAARRRLPRLAVVREAVGLCAYASGQWAEALGELRASKRISGSVEHLPVMADCERGLGRPERALAVSTSPEASQLDRGGSIEMRIVVSGARRDLGQLDAAVVCLQGPELDPKSRDPWSPRLFFAYADALFAAGRIDEAREWFVAAAVADVDGSTDAAERVADIDSATDEVSPADLFTSDVEPGDESAAVAVAAPATQTELVLVFEEPSGG